MTTTKLSIIREGREKRSQRSKPHYYELNHLLLAFTFNWAHTETKKLKQQNRTSQMLLTSLLQVQSATTSLISELLTRRRCKIRFILKKNHNKNKKNICETTRRIKTTTHAFETGKSLHLRGGGSVGPGAFSRRRKVQMEVRCRR